LNRDQIIGTVEGIGSAINVEIGFQPQYVKVVNIDSENPAKPSLEWITGMAAASALKNAGNVCLTSPGLVIGTGSAAKIKITNTVTFLPKGIFKSKATAEAAFTATTHDITADSATVQEACYLVSLSAAGTPTITMGAIASGAGNSIIPSTPAGETAIGYLRLAVAAGSTDFDASSDLLSAGHLTDTYYDLSSLGGQEKITANGISQYAGVSVPATLTGTGSVTAGSAVVTGSSTLFTTELSEGDLISIGNVQRTVLSIASTTSLTVTEDYSAAQSGVTIYDMEGKAQGFTIGADTDINVSGETILYKATR